MKQRIRPILLFKKRSGMFQRVAARKYALSNRLKSLPDIYGGAMALDDYLMESGDHLLMESGDSLLLE